jgi:prophage DNA circulation protein
MQNYKNPSFAGIKYLTQDDTLEHKNNIIEQNYINNEGSEITTSGSQARRISQRAIIDIFSDGGAKERKFQRALEGKRGKLILPYSKIDTNVVVESWSRAVSTTDARNAIFTITFIVDSTDKIILPVKSKKGVFDKYKTKLVNFYATNLESKWKTVSGKYNQYKGVSEKIADVGKQLSVVAGKIRTSGDSLSIFQIEVARFTNDIQNLVNSPVDLIYQINTSISGLVISGSDIKNIFTSLIGLTSKPTATSNATNNGNIAQDIKTNNELISSMIYVNALPECCIALQNMSFETKTELDYYHKLITQAFENMPENLDDDTRKAMNEMRVQVDLMLQQEVLTLNEIYSINTPQTNATCLNYTIYDNFDNYDILLNVNSIKSVGMIQGEIKVVG